MRLTRLLPLRSVNFGRAVQHIAQLLDRQLFGLQRAFEAQRVLRRAHVQLERGEIDLRAGQNGFGPLHQVEGMSTTT